MNEFKRFRVLVNPSDRRRYPHWPQFVPWRLVEPHRDRALKNHDQTLERLNERGGLDPLELYAVIQNLDWNQVKNLDANQCMLSIMRLGGLKV